MQALIELLAGFIALLAAAALAQFGVNLDINPQPKHEVHRVTDCRDAPTASLITSAPSGDC